MKQDKEIKPVKGYEGIYAVTKDGTVFNVEDKLRKRLNPTIKVAGVGKFRFILNGETESFTRDELVELAWGKQPEKENNLKVVKKADPKKNVKAKTNPVKKVKAKKGGQTKAAAKKASKTQVNKAKEDVEKKAKYEEHGQKKYSGKLSISQVLDIKDALAAGSKQQPLADKYGLDIATISAIKLGKILSSYTRAATTK